MPNVRRRRIGGQFAGAAVQISEMRNNAMRRLLTAVAVLVLAASVDPARAATVLLDFNNFAIANNTSLGLPRTIGDFHVTYSTTVTGATGRISSPVGSGGNPGPFNGSNYLTTLHGSFTVSLIPQGSFSLASFDAAETFPGNILNPADALLTGLWARQINVTGTRANGTTVSLPSPFTLDLQNDGQAAGNDFQNFLVTGFNQLVSVTFTGLGGPLGLSGYSLDNISLTNVVIAQPEPDPDPVTPIPLPPSALLFLAGLGGLGLLVWRRERHDAV